MLSDPIGKLLRTARRHLGLTQAELAAQGGVSARLIAELERGERPNVSLESALKLLSIVGVSVTARAPGGVAAEIRSPATAALERAARAAKRRKLWTGRHIHLHDESVDPKPERSKAKRLAAVSHVSRQVFLLAASHQQQTPSRRNRPAAR